MGIASENLADLITTTQKDLGRLRWTDIQQELQEYIALPKILQKEKVGFQSGSGIQWNVMTGNSGAARNVGLYQTDETNAGDVMKLASIPWRHSTTSYIFEEREILMNRDPARVVELVQTRRYDGMSSLAYLMEDNFWGKPASSADEVTPYGIDYWIVDNATQGFNGGTPSGFSDVAGLNTTTYTKWRNWTDRYVDISKTDLVRKVRKAMTYTHFKSPVAHPDYSTGDRYGIYTNYDVISALEELAEAQNDSLGNDLASKDGMVMIRGQRLIWVPKLDADATDPLYGINWGVFKPVFLKGDYLRESAPRPSATAHNVLEVFVDMTYNFECRDRRKLWRIGKAP